MACRRALTGLYGSGMVASPESHGASCSLTLLFRFTADKPRSLPVGYNFYRETVMKFTTNMALVLLLALSASLRADEPPARIERETQTIEGWTVRVDKDLVTGKDAETGKK